MLRPGGRFLFFLNHPLLQTPGSGWIDDDILDEQYWRIGPYLGEDFTLEEVDAGVWIPYIHRPLSVYVNALAARGPGHHPDGRAGAAARVPGPGPGGVPGGRDHPPAAVPAGREAVARRVDVAAMTSMTSSGVCVTAHQSKLRNVHAALTRSFCRRSSLESCSGEKCQRYPLTSMASRDVRVGVVQAVGATVR